MLLVCRRYFIDAKIVRRNLLNVQAKFFFIVKPHLQPIRRRYLISQWYESLSEAHINFENGSSNRIVSSAKR